jgi:hypothetical protein
VTSGCDDPSVISFVRHRELIFFYKRDETSHITFTKVKFNLLTFQEEMETPIEFRDKPNEQYISIIFA